MYVTSVRTPYISCIWAMPHEKCWDKVMLISKTLSETCVILTSRLSQPHWRDKEPSFESNWYGYVLFWCLCDISLALSHDTELRLFLEGEARRRKMCVARRQNLSSTHFARSVVAMGTSKFMSNYLWNIRELVLTWKTAIQSNRIIFYSGPSC